MTALQAAALVWRRAVLFAGSRVVGETFASAKAQELHEQTEASRQAVKAEALGNNPLKDDG